MDSPAPLDAGSPPSREKLLALADLTLAEYLRRLASYGGEVSEQGGVLLFAGTHAQPNPYRNGLLRLDAGLDGEEALRMGREFFGPRRRGFVVWAREHGDADVDRVAASEGLAELERLPEFVLEHPPAHVRLPDGVEMRRTLDGGTRDDFLAVIVDAWGMGSMPRDAAARVFFDPELLGRPDVSAFVAYYDGLPLSGAMAMVTHGVAFAGHAGTVSRLKPGQRRPPRMVGSERRSLAQHSLCAVIDEVFGKLGAELVFCQATMQGAPVWQRLGFVAFTGYRRYLVPAPLAAR